MAKPKQVEMFEQKKVNAIEKWADKVQEKRELMAGLKDEKANAELKLVEAIHANDAAIDHQESENGDKLLIYKRGDYTIVVKRGSEKVNVKIGADSKPEPVDEPEEDAAE